MSHYPSHQRAAFADWVLGGFPDVAVVERGYMPTRTSAEEFLRPFVLPGCTDFVPKDLKRLILDHLGWTGEGPKNMPYHVAAVLLLASRLGVTEDFMAAVLGATE